MNQVLAIVTSSTCVSGEASEAMEHYEAIEMMASERYLLDEMTPELRDAYEDHMFGCAECAHDVRLGAALVDHAKLVLPGMASVQTPVRKPVQQLPESRNWLAWLRPALMVPAFACLLAIIGYQNLVVYPALQASATEPRLLPPATVLQGETRSSVPVIDADLVTGSTLNVPLPRSSSQGAEYSSFSFDFYDSKNKLIWTSTMVVTRNSDDMATIWLPGRIKEDSYRLTTSGITQGGEKILVQRQFFQLRAKN